MKVLVAVATRHGSTREIATELGEVVGSELREEGDVATVDVRYVETALSVAGYDAVILGSAVYMGRWLGTATRFAVVHREALRAVPVWLFSSGAVGDRVKLGEDPIGTRELMETLGARGHQVFRGKIDRKTMRFAERALTTMLRVKDGDYRDWSSVRAWAREVAMALHANQALQGGER